MENKNVPSIRFKGFIDDWEQRKLGKAVTFLNGRAYKQKELLDKGKYRVLRVGNFNTNDFWYYSDLELEDNKYANKGDLLYLWATNFGPEIWKEERVIYHYHIWKLNINDVNLDKNYLYTWLITDKERIKQTSNGTTMVHVTKGGMEERLFQNPINIDEQIKIGNFFKQLDETITLQERELELLKLTKKSFLQQLFTETNQLFPNIRFANFQDEWEQRKLGGLAEYYDGTHQTPRYQESGVPFISVENIKDINNSDKYISKEDYKKDFKIKPQINDIFMTRITAGVIGDTAILTNSDDMAYYVSLALIRASKINPLYLEKYINNFEFKKELHKKIIHTAFPKKINLGDLGTCLVKFPHSFEEQTKIGNFFKQLDETIILQENKLKNLRNVKSAFLQKMFI